MLVLVCDLVRLVRPLNADFDYLQHEAGRAAYEDAQKQIDEIEKKIETKGAGIKNIINELERNKIEKSEAQKLENVCIFFNLVFEFSNCMMLFIFSWVTVHGENFEPLQEYLLEEQRLTPLEKAARQKLTELVSVMESEKSQGSVLKALLHAKEANLIPGIYGRMGDLGAIDGECLYLFNFYVLAHFLYLLFVLSH